MLIKTKLKSSLRGWRKVIGNVSWIHEDYSNWEGDGRDRWAFLVSAIMRKSEGRSGKWSWMFQWDIKISVYQKEICDLWSEKLLSIAFDFQKLKVAKGSQWCIKKWTETCGAASGDSGDKKEKLWGVEGDWEENIKKYENVLLKIETKSILQRINLRWKRQKQQQISLLNKSEAHLLASILGEGRTNSASWFGVFDWIQLQFWHNFC